MEAIFNYIIIIEWVSVFIIIVYRVVRAIKNIRKKRSIRDKR
jgi:hypothetical protein